MSLYSRAVTKPAFCNNIGEYHTTSYRQKYVNIQIEVRLKMDTTLDRILLVDDTSHHTTVADMQTFHIPLINTSSNYQITKRQYSQQVWQQLPRERRGLKSMLKSSGNNQEEILQYNPTKKITLIFSIFASDIPFIWHIFRFVVIWTPYYNFKVHFKIELGCNNLFVGVSLNVLTKRPVFNVAFYMFRI